MERSTTREKLTMTSMCPRCERVEVPVRNIHLWIHEAGDSTFSYVCSRCCSFVRQSADRGTAGMLLAAGPPITHNDVKGFVEEINEEGWDRRVEQLAVRDDVPCGRTIWRRPLQGLAHLVGRMGRRMSQRHRMLTS